MIHLLSSGVKPCFSNRPNIRNISILSNICHSILEYGKHMENLYRSDISILYIDLYAMNMFPFILHVADNMINKRK